MPSISTAERRTRLGLRHSLATRVDTVGDAVRSVVCLHASDPASVYLSAVARVTDATLEDVERELYESRSLVRFLAMRRTMFVAISDEFPTFEAAASREVAASERRKLEKMLAGSGIEDPAGWIETTAAQITDVLRDGSRTARALTPVVPALAQRIVAGPGTKNQTEVGATSRVLGVLAAEGALVRGAPTGTWTTRQYEWHLRADWTGTTDALPDEGEARSWLIAAWLRSFGPGTLTDLRWWTGWGKRRVAEALDSLDVIEVSLDDSSGFVMGDDVETPAPPAPWAALLPALDATPMGWKERHWFLGGHDDSLFDRFGNIGPTVWIDGCIVGGWGQQASGTIVYELLQPVTPDQVELIDAEVAILQEVVGPTQVRPSFATPLQRKLAGAG